MILIRNMQPRSLIHTQSTAGFALLGESKAATALTRGRAQAVILATGSGWKYRRSSTQPPAAHLLLCSLAPNRPQNLDGGDPSL